MALPFHVIFTHIWLLANLKMTAEVSNLQRHALQSTVKLLAV